MEPKANILVIEDEQNIQTALVDFLDYHGFEAHAASDGLEAERIVAEKQFRFDTSRFNAPENQRRAALHKMEA